MNLLPLAVTLFLVLDPFGNAAIFHSVLSKVPSHRRRPILVRELLIALLILLGFLFAVRLIGDKGTRASERLMGLLLILVAVQMFLDGVSTYTASSAP